MAPAQVLIDLNSPVRCSAAANFFGYLAYSAEAETEKRNQFILALGSYWFQFVSEGAGSPVLLPPMPSEIISFLANTSGSYRERLEVDGLTRIQRRNVMAQLIAVRRFCVALDGPKHAPRNIDGLSPGVNNMALVAARHLGLNDNSDATLKDRVWRQSKPVLHALCALSYCWRDWSQTEPKFGAPDCSAEPAIDPILFMMEPERLLVVIELAEEFRAVASNIEGFSLCSSKMIQFLPA